MLRAKNLDHIIFRSYITELEIWASILEVDNQSQLYDSGHIQLLSFSTRKCEIITTKSSSSAFWLNETSILTFLMSENAKQNILGPYFPCKMDKIDGIGHSDANSSLLHQSRVVKCYFDAHFVCSHFGSLKCIIMHRIKDIDQLLPS